MMKTRILFAGKNLKSTSESLCGYTANNCTFALRCISSKELGTLAPPSGSPYAHMLYQREVIEASLQQRLMDARKASTGLDRSITNSPGNRDADESTESSNRRHGGRNESRNRRRAEHTKEVISDLCEIVADLFVAESKLLNPTSYGVDSSFQRDQILNTVKNFVNALPPRYALGVEAPSEVLVHMRLLAAARSDNAKAVVHITNLEGSHWEGEASTTSTRGHRTLPRRSRHLVTICCQDALGLLEYITKLLASGGSRVLDADVMLSNDNIALVSLFRTNIVSLQWPRITFFRFSRIVSLSR